MGLVITRSEGESFYIGDEIEVYVASIRGGRARLHIKAPTELNIYRDEHLTEEKNNKTDIQIEVTE